MAPTKRNTYSFETKMAAIKKVQGGAARSVVQKEFGISSGTLSKWMNDSSKIIAKIDSGCGKIKKAKPTPYPKTATE